MDSYLSRSSNNKIEYSEKGETEIIYTTYNQGEYIHSFQGYHSENYLYYI